MAPFVPFGNEVGELTQEPSPRIEVKRFELFNWTTYESTVEQNRCIHVDDSAREANHYELVRVYLVVQGTQISILL